MKRLMFFAVMAMVISLGFSSCDKDDDGDGGSINSSLLLGTWQWIEDGEVYDELTFKKDGTIIVDDEVGKYSVITTKEAIKKYGAVENLPDGNWLVIDWDEDMDTYFIKSFDKNRLVLSVDPNEPDIVLQRID